MAPSIFRTPDFLNQSLFSLEVQKIGIPLYFMMMILNPDKTMNKGANQSTGD